MRKPSRPYLIILDNDLELAAHMLTEKDLRRQINMAYNLLIYIYFKRSGLSNNNVWKYVVEHNFDLVQKMLPDWPILKYPILPPKCKKIEYKFIKLCLNHFNYVLQYAQCMCNEFEKRYNKKHIKSILFTWINNHLPDLPEVDNYTVRYPIRSIPIFFRKETYVLSAINLYKSMIEDPMKEYNKVDVPDFFNLHTDTY